MYVNPWQIDPWTPVNPNPIPAGGEAIGEFETFDAFDLFVMLGVRGDAYAALRAADLVVGGGSQTYRQADGKVCVRAMVELRGGTSHADVTSALQAWAAGMPGATVEDLGPFAAFTWCDPAVFGACSRATRRWCTRCSRLATRSHPSCSSNSPARSRAASARVQPIRPRACSPDGARPTARTRCFVQ